MDSEQAIIKDCNEAITKLNNVMPTAMPSGLIAIYNVDEQSKICNGGNREE